MTIPRNLSFLAEGASSTGVLGTANGGTGLNTLGTAGQALVVNSGATGLQYSTPSAGAMTLISTQTSGYSWTSLGSYKSFILIFNSINNIGGGNLLLQVGTGSTPTFITSGYSWNGYTYISSITGYNNTSDSGMKINLFSSTATLTGNIQINCDPTTATSDVAEWSLFNNGNGTGIMGSGTIFNNVAATGIRLVVNTGSINGTASLYGISS